MVNLNVSEMPSQEARLHLLQHLEEVADWVPGHELFDWMRARG